MRRQPIHQSQRKTLPNEDRRGAMLPVLVLLFPLFFATAAFSVDVAYMHLTRTQLRRSTDAAARAAADSLLRYQDTELAKAAARDLAGENLVAGEPLLLSDSEIIFGNSQRQSDGTWLFVAEDQPFNAVRINSQQDVSLFFGPVLGVRDFAPTQSATAARLDRDIVIVIDRSTSMKWSVDESTSRISTSDPRVYNPPNMETSRWADLCLAVEEFCIVLDQISNSEQVGLASYGGDHSIWPHGSNTYTVTSDINQDLTFDHELVRLAMDEISSMNFNGFTTISEGIDRGVEVLTESPSARPAAFKTMLLMTDGIWNRGRLPEDAAEDAAQHNIVIHAVTFSDEANQADMRDVAEATGGQFFHAPDAETLQEAFRKIAQSLPVVITE